jgi:glycosyltransferase involved in cell wall biosynthesis
MAGERKQRRVFIVSPTESELTIRGKRHPNLACHLASRGWHVEYISSTLSHAEKRLFSDEECRGAAGRVSYSLSFVNAGIYQRNISLQRVLWHRRFVRRCYRRLKRELREGDVLIVRSPPPELVAAAAALKRERGCRILMDIEDAWPDAMSESSGLLKRAFASYCDRYLRRSVAQFDAYIHVAPSFLPWLHRYAPRKESTFIPLGFDEKRWGQEPPVRPRPETGCFKLVHCGTLTYQFDVMPVLKAVARLRGRFRLTLIGDNGNGDRYGDVMAFVRENSLEANVTVMGLLPPRELVKELPRHDIAIVPMVSGALPNKVFDAIAAGLPLLSLGSGDSSALVEQCGLGWTAPFDPEAVRGVLEGIAPDEIEGKTQNVLRQRANFMHGELFDTYERVIADRCTGEAAKR